MCDHDWDLDTGSPAAAPVMECRRCGAHRASTADERDEHLPTLRWFEGTSGNDDEGRIWDDG